MVYSFDIVYLTETFIFSETRIEKSNQDTCEYNIFCAAHPSSIKGEGVCIFCCETLPLKVLSINDFQEYINFYQFIFTSQLQNGSESFLSNFEIRLDSLTRGNLFVSVIIGDANAKSNNWYVISDNIFLKLTQCTACFFVWIFKIN